MAKPSTAALFPNILHPKKRAWLAAYVTSGRVCASFQAAHIDNSLHYYWLRTDPAYAQAVDDAQAMIGDVLEDEATRRALGTDEPVYDAEGRQVGTVRKASDTLLIFLLKGLKPDKYKEIRKEEQHVTLTVRLEERLTKALTQMEATRNGHRA